MRDLNFNLDGDLILEEGQIDTDTSNALSNRLRTLVEKSWPVFYTEFRSNFLGKREFEDTNLRELEIESWLIFKITSLYPLASDLDNLKAHVIIIGQKINISFYYLNDYDEPTLIFFNNTNF